MYSIVLLAAMTAAPETPQFNGLFAKCFHKQQYSSCYGCTGCYGGVSYSSCYGCTGCRGYSCWGCTGCTGCWGCTGYSCHGIPTVGCYGCCGGTLCIGGCISTYAPVGASCYGQHFSPYSSCTGYGSYQGHYGSFTVTTGYAAAPEYGIPTYPESTPISTSELANTQAKLNVQVPADAKLYVDGHLTSLTGTDRSFSTPTLTAGRDYQYTIKVEYTDNGETKTASKQVVVRGGHRTNVNFSLPTEVKASSPVTVQLPAKAKLYVDDTATSATGGKHTFRTPELTKGQPYTYQFRAEVERDGQVEVLNQKVVFRAGEPINVDFTEANAVRTAAK